MTLLSSVEFWRKSKTNILAPDAIDIRDYARCLEYVLEGLRDHDQKLGTPVPLSGYLNKRIKNFNVALLEFNQLSKHKDENQEGSSPVPTRVNLGVPTNAGEARKPVSEFHCARYTDPEAHECTEGPQLG